MNLEIINGWLIDHSVKIGLILAAVYILHKFFIDRLIEKIVRKAVVADKYSSPEAEKKR